MAYDADRGEVVLFGGDGNGWDGNGILGDTWTWDGTDWTQRSPVHAPSPRASMGMAYDAAHGQVVLFGGFLGDFGDTWIWDGTDWAVPFRASATLRPKLGPPGTAVRVHGWGFGALEKVQLTYIDSTNGTRKLGVVATDVTGAFAAQVTIPLSATPGNQLVKAKGRGSGQRRRKVFTVT
jgi:hypothetical protein